MFRPGRVMLRVIRWISVKVGGWSRRVHLRFHPHLAPLD
jgi:hypothetical protein